MKVFIIGATGWIGEAITTAALDSGYKISALARSEASKKRLGNRNIAPVPGDITDLSVLASAASEADAVVVASSAERADTVTALEKIIDSLRGTNKTLIYISGSSLYGDIGDKEAVEESLFIEHLASPEMRGSPELVVFQARQQGVNSVILVGAGILYGYGGGATPRFWLDDARQRQAAWYIGSGEQRWSGVHVHQLAYLAMLVLEKKPANPVFNAVTEAISLRDAAKIVAQATKAANGVQSVSQAAARSEWGGFWSQSLTQNLWLSPKLAQTVLDWRTGPTSFEDDMLHGLYQIK